MTIEVSIIIKLIKKMLRIQRKPQKNLIDKKFLIARSAHQLSKADINVNAIKVLNRLNSSGFEAYLVGGSVRDLLLKKMPKDFDIATNATPTQVRSLFRNSRIIGRRFKLVHVLYNRDIIEVATFRRGHEELDINHQTNDQGMLIRDNVFGSLEEDAWRRDISINSLYYNLADGSIIDFTHGVADIQQQTIRMIGDPAKRYQEDPVRMLRVIRFGAKLQFTIETTTAKTIFNYGHLLSGVSSSRLFDEMTKLYQCGHAHAAQQLLLHYQLFQYLFPETMQMLNNSAYPIQDLINIAMNNTDQRIRANKTVTPAFIFAVFLWFPMLARSQQLQSTGLDALPAIEKAMSLTLAEQHKIIAIPKRFSMIIREMWLMQFRFAKRTGNRAYHVLEHSRFRAAYDFLLLRALAKDESAELAQWWTTFQAVSEDAQQRMIDAIEHSAPPAQQQQSKTPPKAT